MMNMQMRDFRECDAPIRTAFTVTVILHEFWVNALNYKARQMSRDEPKMLG